MRINVTASSVQAGPEQVQWETAVLPEDGKGTELHSHPYNPLPWPVPVHLAFSGCGNLYLSPKE